MPIARPFRFSLILISILSMIAGCSNPLSTLLLNERRETKAIISLEEQQEATMLVDDIINEMEDQTKDTTPSLLSRDEAIIIAEPILFQTYGTGLILSQKPYQTSLSGTVWTIEGSLASGYIGGVFTITIDALNATMIDMIHTQ